METTRITNMNIGLYMGYIEIMEKKLKLPYYNRVYIPCIPARTVSSLSFIQKYPQC